MAGKHSTHTRYRPSVRSVVLGVFFSTTLAISLFAAGFAVCTLPGTTGLLSRLFSDFETCAFLPSETTELAVATRDFTVDYHSNTKQATEDLAKKIMEAARHSAAQDSLKASMWKNIRIGTTSTVTDMYTLAQQGSQYAFSEQEISHLNDCNKLIRITIPVLIVIAVCALVFGVILRVTCGRRAFGHALVAAPTLLLCGMLAFFVWIVVDFNTFFSSFHALLFPQGNWTFPANSLLICMLPTAFWIAMAVLWVFITISLAIFAVFIGRALGRA